MLASWAPWVVARRSRAAVELAKRDPNELLRRLHLLERLRRPGVSAAWRYLDRHALRPLLVAGQADEFGLHDAKAVDLVHLHRQILRRHPAVVLEFGCGYSTLVMAAALASVREATGAESALHVLEASHAWADNTRRKLPPNLAQYVTWHVETPELLVLAGQVCHVFPALPDVRPDLIYLDGPDPRDVTGEVRGLSFRHGRLVCAADPLFYEWDLWPGALLVVDGRHTNVAFLRANLRRRYRVRRHWIHDYTTFELLG